MIVRWRRTIDGPAMDSPDRLSEHIRASAIKSALLIAGFPFVIPTVVFVFILFAGGLLGMRNAGAAAGQAFVFMLVAMLVVTVVWLPIGYLINQWIIDKATGARLLGRHEEPRLWALFEALCSKCGMRLPALRIIETDVMNAFASGLTEGRYSVTVTRGLIDELNDDEIEAVLAHELAHIRNHDVRLLVVATVLVGMVPMLHDVIVRGFWMLLMGILGIYRAIFSPIPMPLVRLLVDVSYTGMFWIGKGIAFAIGAVGKFCSLVIHFALSRRREFMADAGAVEMTGKPEALISALRRISCNSGMETNVAGVKAMLFDSPSVFGLDSLFATHPPVEARIEALLQHAPRRQEERSDTRATATPEPPSDPPAAHPAANAVMVDRFRTMLLSAMGGAPERALPERRQQIYERAARALAAQVTTKPPMPAADAEIAAESLWQAIDAIEANLYGAGQTRP